MIRGALLLIVILVNITFVGAQPRWVKKHPTDSKYYIGVGSVSKLKSSNYVDEGRNIALNQIASGISVSIESAVSQQVIEKSGIVTESFQNNIKAVAKAKLSDYELVDTYETNADYWVYYRLSKELFHANFEKAKQIAIADGAQNFADAKKYEQAQKYDLALKSYIKSVSVVAPYRGMGLLNPASESPEYFDVELFRAFDNFMASVSITISKGVVPGVIFEKIDHPIEIKAVYKTTEKYFPLSKIPFKVNVLRGKVEINEISPTNEDGIAQIRIAKLKSAGEVVVESLIDCESYVGLPCESIHLIKPKLIIEVKVPAVFMEGESGILMLKCKEFLAKQGWNIVDNSNDCDFVIRVNASVSNGVDMGGVCTAFSNGTVAIRRSNNEEIFSVNATKVVGGGGSFEMAHKASENKLADQIIQKIKQELF